MITLSVRLPVCSFLLSLINNRSNSRAWKHTGVFPFFFFPSDRGCFRCHDSVPLNYYFSFTHFCLSLTPQVGLPLCEPAHRSERWICEAAAASQYLHSAPECLGELTLQGRRSLQGMQRLLLLPTPGKDKEICEHRRITEPKRKE